VYLDRRLWALTRGVRWRIAGAVALGLLAVAAGIARLALLGWLLARVLAGDGPAALAGPAALVAAAIVARGVLDHARTMVAHRTAARVQARLRERLHTHVTGLGPAYFAGSGTGSRTGEVAVSLVEGVQQLEIYFGQYLPQLGVAALTPGLIVAAVAWIDRPVALVLLTAAVFTLVAPAAWHRRDSARSLARQHAYATYAAEFLDVIQGLATLKAFGQSGPRATRLEAEGRALARHTMGVLGTNTLARGITDTGMAVGAAIALAVGAWRVQAGLMDLPALLVILMLGVEVFRPLRELRVLLHQGMLGRSAAEGILALLAAVPPVRDDGPPGAGSPTPSPTVAFTDVTFAYPGGRGPALDGLSFTVRPGERVGLVGPSGAGKSTVTRLLLRLYDPARGVVRLGGRDVRQLSLAELRRHLAVVSQDTYLFHGTVEDNLRMGKPDATPSELEAAARAAGAHGFVSGLPAGYRTVVGERGLRLSGGQRQRIAIARALLRDAPVLILDEALSSVDAENEAAIQAALERLMAGRTTVICAHRLSSVIGVDRILVLDGGRVIEEGPHAELMARRGAYFRLMASQARDGASAGDGTAGVRSPAPEAPPGAAPAATPTEGIVRAEGLGWGGVLRALLGLSRGYRGRLGVTFLLGVARVAALVGVGVASALTVRAVARGEPLGSWLALLAVIAPLAGLLHWLESWLAHDVAYRLLADMRLALFRKLDALAPAYLTRRRTGDLVGVATHDVELIEYFFAHTITPAAVAVLVPSLTLAVLGASGWPMAVALLPFLVFAALRPVAHRATIDALGARAREAAGELNAHAVDTVQGLAEVVAFEQAEARGRAFEDRARAYVAARIPFLRDQAREAALQEVAAGLGGLAVAVTGALLVTGGRLDGGLLPLLTLLAMATFVPVWEIAQVGRQLADTVAATRRVYAIHAEPVPVTDGPGIGVTAATGPARPPALALDDVRFTYPGRRQPALAGVSFAVPGGSTVALVGPSGAGKTTVASLLLRFWDPDAGVVRLDGHDLRRWRLDDLRRQIALVAQDTYLFNDTLRANILLARPEASAAAVAEAVSRAALADLVGALPAGLDTPVGECGVRLSGGQRQRVAIARALLKDAPVLILDEATSHLDAVNEEAVRTSLGQLARGRTTIVIAHRLSTVRDADRIVVLDQGRVVETGPHAALLARGGLYAQLVARQLAGAASREG
jgi:ATP-binding cassette subfamily C protein CydCD